ncbi:hypothetical protein [Nocardia vulneris]|uniref:Uncharacterized protein n=1 Tax=Nocardia vulneris TaxID=1141657 RepID=A0ABR4ZCD8_9NOCA|nr:hypothetical protein [Nocardia vulneris]KIA62985.1 hypothetical protein FG87_21620 [Nocardia vulneris]
MNITEIDPHGWRNWSEQFSVDLTRFRVSDAPEMRDLNAYTLKGLESAEHVAGRLFPPDIDWHPNGVITPVADRWNRSVGHTFMLLLRCGEWVNAPRDISGPRNQFGVLPCVLLPDGRHIPPMLTQVLEALARGDTFLVGAVIRERFALDEWAKRERANTGRRSPGGTRA